MFCFKLCFKLTLTLVFTVSSVSCLALDITNGLEAHFKFNQKFQSVSVVINDTTGNGNGLEIDTYGTYSTNDRFGRPDSAVHFSGDCDTLSVKTSFPSLKDGERTISAWFRTTANDRMIVSVGAKGFNMDYAFSARTTDVRLYGYVTSNDLNFNNGQNYLDNEWRHITVRKKGSNSQLFINGKFIGVTPNHVYNTGGDLGEQMIRIGGWADENRCFLGDIDDVRIYSRALDEWEIDYIYRFCDE